MICEACGRDDRPDPVTELGPDREMIAVLALVASSMALVATWFVFKPVIVAPVLAAAAPVLLGLQALGLSGMDYARILSTIADVLYGDIPMSKVPFSFVSHVLDVKILAVWGLVATAAFWIASSLRRRKA